jgi:hypothetical protein
MLLPLILSLSAFAAGPKASSTLKNEEATYDAALAFDGLLTSGWAEGELGSGEGQWLELDLGRTTQIDTLAIWPGNLSQGAKSFREFGRPRKLTVTVDGKPVGDQLTLLDKMQRVELPVGASGRKLRITIDESYEGMVFADLFIAEVAINFPSNERAVKLDKFLQSPGAREEANEYGDKLDTAYVTHKGAEFGDKESLAFIMDAVADGPTFLRPHIHKYVPAGFRAQAVRSSKRAQKALRKLKDSNAIPAFEMASLRADEDEQRLLAETVEVFYAYQELIGGPSRNVGYWGEPGWALGQLQALGEPITLEVDRLANVYAADVGNSRIQMFNDEGRPMRQWGPDPDITQEWFGRNHPWYVSGAKPGDGQGQWENPVDVEIIPEKEVDGFAALDAKGKIGVFDSEGRPRISWTVETKNDAQPALGGTSYLEWSDKKQQLIAIIEDEVVTYTLDSEEVNRFHIADGTPNAVEVGKNGRLLMVFGDEIKAYNPADGFSYGTVISDAILGEGFEDVDLTLDEEGKLWVLTDKGWVFKFKKPGKLEYKIRVFTRPLSHPRIAVREGILYMCSDDRIERVDILQMRLDQAAEAKEAAREKPE